MLKNAKVKRTKSYAFNKPNIKLCPLPYSTVAIEINSLRLYPRNVVKIHSL